MAWVEPARAAHWLKRRQWRKQRREKAGFRSDTVPGPPSLVPTLGRGRLCSQRGCVQVRGAGQAWRSWGCWLRVVVPLGAIGLHLGREGVTAVSSPLRPRLWPLLCGAGGHPAWRWHLVDMGSSFLVVPGDVGCGLPLVSSPHPQPRGSPLFPQGAWRPDSPCWDLRVKAIMPGLCPLAHCCLRDQEAMSAPGWRFSCPKGRTVLGAVPVRVRLPRPLGRQGHRGPPAALPRAQRRPPGRPWP